MCEKKKINSHTLRPLRGIRRLPNRTRSSRAFAFESGGNLGRPTTHKCRATTGRRGQMMGWPQLATVWARFGQLLRRLPCALAMGQNWIPSSSSSFKFNLVALTHGQRRGKCPSSRLFQPALNTNPVDHHARPWQQLAASWLASPVENCHWLPVQLCVLVAWWWKVNSLHHYENAFVSKASEDICRCFFGRTPTRTRSKSSTRHWLSPKRRHRQNTCTQIGLAADYRHRSCHLSTGDR